MIKNIFLDRLKPIYFKEEIPIIYLDKLQEDEKFPCKYVLKNIIKYTRNEKVYQIKSSKKQNLLLKIIVFKNNELKEALNRVEEIAKMLSSDEITKAARQTAVELLSK